MVCLHCNIVVDGNECHLCGRKAVNLTVANKTYPPPRHGWDKAQHFGTPSQTCIPPGMFSPSSPSKPGSYSNKRVLRVREHSHKHRATTKVAR